MISSFLSKYGKGHYHDDIRPASYRVHDNSLFSSKGTLQKRMISYETRRTLMDYHSYKKPFYKELAKYSYLIGRSFRSEKDLKQAIKFQMISIKYSFKDFNFSLMGKIFRELVKMPL